MAEAIALRALRFGATAIAIHTDPGARILRSCAELAPSFELDSEADAGTLRADVLVLATDGETARPALQARILRLAPTSRGIVILCEPQAPGHALGRPTLQRLDAGALAIHSDEVPASDGTTRRRRPWEAAAQWHVATAAAWRFEIGAEEVRASLCRRLPSMRASQMLVACRRVLQRHPTAFEVLVLCGEEAQRRGDLDLVRALGAELAAAEAPRGDVARLRRAAVACGGVARRDATSVAG